MPLLFLIECSSQATIVTMSSKVWQYMNKTSKPDKVKCVICECELSYKGGSTSTLLKHCLRKHPDTKDVLLSKREAPSNQPTLASFTASKAMLSSSSPRSAALTECIMDMICIDLQPLSITEDYGFKKFINKAEPRYVLPSRTTIRKKLIPNLYSSVLDELKAVINDHKASKGTFGITADGWTGRTARSFVTYTLHFITRDYKMVAYNIGTFRFKQDHTAQNLISHIYSSFVHCGIIERSESQLVAGKQDQMPVPMEDDDETNTDNKDFSELSEKSLC